MQVDFDFDAEFPDTPNIREDISVRLQHIARAMLAIVLDTTTSQVEKQLAYTTINEIVVAYPEKDMTGILPFQQRVIDEYEALKGNRIRLGDFFETETYAGLDKAEQDRLETQYHLQRCLERVLIQRIEAMGQINRISMPRPPRAQ